MTDQQFNRLCDIAQNGIRREHKAATEFVAVDRVVMLGSYCVARAKSKTYAIRIAHALNAYKPNARGV